MALLKTSKSELQLGINSQVQPDPRETTEILDPSCSTIGCCYNDPIFQDNEMDRRRAALVREDEGVIKDNLASSEEMEDEDLLLCPCWVYGFVLRSRKWCQSHVHVQKYLATHSNNYRYPRR